MYELSIWFDIELVTKVVALWKKDHRKKREHACQYAGVNTGTETEISLRRNNLAGIPIPQENKDIGKSGSALCGAWCWKKTNLKKKKAWNHQRQQWWSEEESPYRRPGNDFHPYCTRSESIETETGLSSNDENLNRRIEAGKPVKKDHLALNLLINLIRDEKIIFEW